MRTILCLLFLFSGWQSMALKGDAHGTLMDIYCYSDFEGRRNDRVRMLSRERDEEGYTSAMTVRVDWVSPERNHFANMELIQVHWNQQEEILDIIGVSQGGNVLRLVISDPSPRDSVSTMYINGKPQDYLKFRCDVPMAG